MLKGEVIADGPCTDHGELALGRNVLVAFMPVSYTHLDVYKRQVDRIAIKDKKLFWTLDPASEKPTNLLGMKLAHSVKNKSGEEIAHSGRKLNAQILKEIQKAKISEIEVLSLIHI